MGFLTDVVKKVVFRPARPAFPRTDRFPLVIKMMENLQSSVIIFYTNIWFTSG